jgi:hypothetical protein
MTSAVPLIQFTSTGLVLPTEADILAGTQSDLNTAFGGLLNPALNTPQGQLASTQAAILGDMNNQFAFYVNGINPDFSSGFMQDAIGRIYFMTRKPAQPTSVTVTITGVAGTVIPVGAIAYDTSNNQYLNTDEVTISAGGTVNTTFANVATGPIGCPANTLNIVGQTITGWDAINNSGAGILGTDVEMAQQFEFRRAQSVAANAHGSPQAIYGEVFAVEDVLDVFVVDNPSGSVVNYGATNYPLAAHSVYVAVTGGESTDIAQAIWSKKDLGCSYNSNVGVGATVVTVTVTDNSGYSVPYPTYDVTYLVPLPTPVYFAVRIASNSGLPANIITLTQNAVLAAFSGQDGGQPARIGSSIYSSRYYTGIVALSPYVNILSLYVNTSPSPITSSVTLGIDQQPTLSVSNITVTLV